MVLFVVLPFILMLRSAASAVMPKYVFAHYIVGNAAHLTQDQLETDMRLAKHASIDGFALNIAQNDAHTDSVLAAAYSAAENIDDGFWLFLSFDYLSGGPWEVQRVVELVDRFKNRSAQFHYYSREGGDHYGQKPLVSTFEGVSNTNDWAEIRNRTDCFVIPDWTSLGPEFLATDDGLRDAIDGFFSWDAWPVGTENKSTRSDEAWVDALGADKVYMMPVSPWFYTNLPQWNKNWLWKGAQLWTQRWDEIYYFQPDLVQIISWNDYGESHYIGPVHLDGIPQGASRYVEHNPHDAWRALLPYFIACYKTGDKSRVRVTRDTLVFWYRPNPNDSGSNDGTTGNSPAHGQAAMDPQLLAEDKIYIAALVKEPSWVLVQIGNGEVVYLEARQPGLNTFEVPFDRQLGNTTFAIVRHGKEVAYATGPPITRDCVDGKINWNAVAGSSVS